MPNNHYGSAIENNAVTQPNNAAKKNPHREPMILKLFQLFFSIAGRLSPSLAGRFGYNLWLTPTRFKAPLSEREYLNSAKIEYHAIDNQKIATFHWGGSEANSKTNKAAVNAPMVLLVHGWSGRGTQLGPFVKPLVDAGYQVISFDAPAHGLSSGKQTSLYQYADVILALQEYYGMFDSVISHSFGGPCTAVAIQRGLQAKRVVSICPPATTIGLIDKFCDTLHIPEKAKNIIIKRIQKTFGENILHDVSMVNTVKEIDIPGMIIHDSHDSDIPWQEGQSVAQAWNSAPFIITTGLGHRRILRDQTVIKNAISFIQQV